MSVRAPTSLDVVRHLALFGGGGGGFHISFILCSIEINAFSQTLQSTYLVGILHQNSKVV